MKKKKVIVDEGTITSTDEKNSDQAKDANIPFPVVGIGASAGGIEAISGLFENLDPNLGMAYVVIMHLSPNHGSMLAEIFEKKTAMPVKRIEDDMEIQPNTVYVVPAHLNIGITNSALKIYEITPARGPQLTIDYFFSNLSAIFQSNAIGIVLSGTGADGTMGLKAIKAHGGITFAQNDTAQFHGMPNNARDSGYVDNIMPPEQIAAELSILVKNSFGANIYKDELSEHKDDIKRILLFVYNRNGVDFTNYKQTTIHRRIIRRMMLTRLTDLKEYIRLLRENSVEVEALYHDLLINVTDFFRDSVTYQALTRKIFPALIKNKSSTDPIRIWIPGCSTGEEAYSFAICLLEYLGIKAISTPVQIFATDLNERSIEKARTGLYSQTELKNVSNQRLKHFFTKIDGNYQVVKAIRDICIYASHNLLKDPPFSRMDLISCQNVMIYFEANPQKNILQGFHYALKNSGFLLLGKSETIGTHTELFELTDKDYRIYTKKSSNPYQRFDFSIRSKFSINDHHNEPAKQIEPGVDFDIDKETDKLLLSSFVPASVLVNKDLEILRFHGNTSFFMAPSSGKASLNLLKMVKNELVFEVRTLIFKAKKEGVPVRKEGIQFPVNGQLAYISLEAVPLRANTKNPFYLILFQEQTNPSYKEDLISDGTVSKKKEDQHNRRVAALQREIREARESMKIMSEEFESTREELQSANEEVLSSNEELQSINEELETSKEELQSTNEELTTLNEELQHRNNDLKEANDYSYAIVETIREPLIVLDADLRIRTANKAFYRFFKTNAEDTEGRYFLEIGNGEWRILGFDKQITEMFSKNKDFQNIEVRQTFAGVGEKVMLINAIRMLQFDTKKDRILLAIHDITQTKKSEAELRKSQERYQEFLTQSTEGIYRFELEHPLDIHLPSEKQVDYMYEYGYLEECNDSMAKMCGFDNALSIEGAKLRDFIPRNEHNQRYLLDFIRSGYRLTEALFYEKDKEGNPRVFINNLIGICEDGFLKRAWGTQRDFTEQKKAEHKLKESEERFRLLIQNSFDIITIYAEDGSIKYLSPSVKQVLGYDYDTAPQKNEADEPSVHPDDLEIRNKMLGDSIANPQQIIKGELRLRHKEGHYKIFEVVCVNLLHDSRIEGIVANYRDITERKKPEW